MCFIRPHTFDHEPFRRGKQDMYPIAYIERFDTDFCMQLHFIFLATQTTQKQKQAINVTRASRLRDVDLDALPENTYTSTRGCNGEFSRAKVKKKFWFHVCKKNISQKNVTKHNSCHPQNW